LRPTLAAPKHEKGRADRADAGLAPLRAGVDRRSLGGTPCTAFRFAQEGPVPRLYWVDQGFGYALSGNLGRDELMGLAEAVYGQL
jgi:anti-sigma factor RsiW